MYPELYEWVLYQPPKSVSFGHQSRIRNARHAWAKTEEFLAGLTKHSFGHRMELTCHGPDTWTDPALAMLRIREARALFGQETNPSDAHLRWTISEPQLSSAIQFALDDDKFPTQQIGPTRLHFYYRFVWSEFERNPYHAAGDEAREQASTLGVFIGRKRLFLQPTLIFPAPWNSHLLRDFLSRIEPMLPFRFRDQYFQRMLPTKRGRKWGRTLKLSKNWRTSPEFSSGSPDQNPVTW